MLMIFDLLFLLLHTAQTAEPSCRPLAGSRPLLTPEMWTFPSQRQSLSIGVRRCSAILTLPPPPPPVALNGQIFHHSSKLRWLGYWFVPDLASSAHFSRRLALSQAAFASVQRLSAASKAVAPHICHRLPYCLMFPILSYGADLYTPTKGQLTKMDVHWGQIPRWITNCFQSTSIPVLAAESCLPPLCVLLTHKRRMAALCLISSPSTINPASARLCRNFPSRLDARASYSHRALVCPA